VKNSLCAGLAAALAVVALAGCSGGTEPSGVYKDADAEQLAAVAPRTPGWPPWPQEPDPPREASGESAEEIAARDPIYAEYRRKTAGIETADDWGSGNHWEDGDKLANLVVAVFDTADDAHTHFLASNDLSRA
jgi:hypothetical protein